MSGGDGLPAVGTVLNGRYTLTGQLGQGGMATVFSARTPEGATVAVKILSEDLVSDSDQRERFQREARALFGLAHPNLLRVHDFGVVGGQLPYLVMERLEGQPLDEVLEGGALEPSLALHFAAQVLSGLAHAHAHGVLHRDIKTENIFLHRTPNGPVAKLLDFGLVKFVDGERWGAGKQITTYGEVFGTPAYMSPEQCTGAPVDARTDVYSMGVVLYEMLTGVWPFMEETKVAMMRAHLSCPVPPLGSTRDGWRFRPELDALLARAMAKEPAGRFTGAADMADAVRALPQPAALPLSQASSEVALEAPAESPSRASHQASKSAWIMFGVGVGVACLVLLTALLVMLARA